MRGRGSEFGDHEGLPPDKRELVIKDLREHPDSTVDKAWGRLREQFFLTDVDVLAVYRSYPGVRYDVDEGTYWIPKIPDLQGGESKGKDEDDDFVLG